jgi:hypothetical protein
MVKFKNFLAEESQEEYASLLDELNALLTSEGATEFWISDKSETIEIQDENYIQRKDGEIVKSQKLYKDGGVVNYDLAISRLKDAIKAVKAGNIVTSEGE